VLGGGVATGAFWLVTLLQRPVVGMVLIGWFGVAYVYYRYRLAKTDRIETYRTMTTLDVHERVEESEAQRASDDASGDTSRANTGERRLTADRTPVPCRVGCQPRRSERSPASRVYPTATVHLIAESTYGIWQQSTRQLR